MSKNWCLYFCLLPGYLLASSYTWNNTSGGSWTTGTNWTPNGFPNAVGDAAVFPAITFMGTNITVSQDITLSNLSASATSGREYTFITMSSNKLIFQTASGNASITTSDSRVFFNLPVLANSPLTLSSSNPLHYESFSGVISDNGSGITVTGSTSRADFSAINTYTGPTTIAGGLLSLTGSGSIASSSGVSIATNASLDISAVTTGATVKNVTGAGSINLGAKEFTFQNISNTIYEGVISAGSGSVVKSGAGSLTLTERSLYTGATTVSEGTLIVTGNIAASSSVTVNPGATLKGNTTLPALTIQGTLQPGTSIGAITAASLSQTTGSTLSIEFNGTTNSVVTITGAANIEPAATLQLIPQVANYVDGTIYTFLSAGTLTGTFDTINLANANLGESAVLLLPPTSNSLSFIISLLDSQQRAPISLTSSLGISLSRNQMGLITQIQDERYHLQQLCCCDFTTGSELCEKCGGGAKTCDKQGVYHPYVVFNNFKTDIRSRTYTTPGEEELWSGLVGTDFYLNSTFTGGLAFGYTRGRAHSSTSNTVHINCDSFTGNAYFQLNPIGKFYLDGGAVYGYTFYNSHRRANGNIRANYHGDELSSQLRLLYQNCLGWLWARPYVAGSYYLNHVSSYTEKGSSYSRLAVDKSRFNFLDLEGGLYLWAPIRCQGWTFVPEVSCAYVTAFLNEPYNVDMGPVIQGSKVFSQRVDNVSDEYWKLNGGFSIAFDDCKEFFFRFSTVFDEAYNVPESYTLGFEAAF